MYNRLILTVSLYILLNSFFIMIIAQSKLNKTEDNHHNANSFIQDDDSEWKSSNHLNYVKHDNVKRVLSDLNIVTAKIINEPGFFEIAIPANQIFIDNKNGFTDFGERFFKEITVLINKNEHLKHVEIKIGSGNEKLDILRIDNVYKFCNHNLRNKLIYLLLLNDEPEIKISIKQ